MKDRQEMKVLPEFTRVWNRIIDTIMILAGVLLWGQMVIVNVEVFSRALGHPTTWVTEISSILVLWIPFMIAGWVLKRDGHVKMDLLVERLSVRSQALINFVTSLIGVVVMLIVALAGFLTTVAWIGNKTPTMLMLPRSPIIGVIFIGSLLFAVQFLIRAFENFNQWKAEKAKARGCREKAD
jgi:TRAP-type C4-dicarboxylate transport system permease small subunit